jgi:glutathione S-transferase
MRLHSAPKSGNGYKVRLLMGLLGIGCEVIDYDTKGGATHTPEFLENVNPDGKVPVLELDDGTMLPESSAIMLYLAEGTLYLPEQKLERTQVLRWMFFEQYSLLLYLSRPRLWKMWGVEITAQKEAELEDLFEQGYRALGVMERHLTNHEFFVEDRPTTADVALYVYPRVCHEGGYDLEGFPAVRAWMERIESLPGYVAPPG